ncbi:MAG: methylated-DNA--[protein]-cysteine S-methyltransferase, partial [Oceanipulchritudo sp.]
LHMRTVPRKFMGRTALWPRGASLGLWARLVFEVEFLRYMAALMPFVVATLIWRDYALAIAQAPIPMLILIYLVEARLLRVPPGKRAGLVSEAEAERGLDLPLDIQGTAFQRRVWAALQEIPAGETLSYAEVADRIGKPQSARAVAGACAANTLAVAIPCHRVVPAGGGTGRYRWGAAAKEKLLAWEKSRANGGTDEQAAVEVRKLEAMLLNAQRFEDISRLAGSIAHDLNNLLAPIRMAMELLKRKSSDPSLERYFDIIETSTNRARSVIQGILGFARESNGSIARIVAVQPVLRELENMASETFPSEITIAFDYDGGSSRVKIDPDQLHRALLNLLVNARDAMDGPGRITVKTSSHEVERGVCLGERCLDPGRYVCISVSDTGCGIPAGIRDNIFDPFFTTKPKEDGTGLGLATVFGTISRAGGFIDLESAEGKGTTFHLFLPEVRGA